jgi:SAM-dependent methyltransferase
MSSKPKVLSVGCGFGADVARFRALGIDAVGVDISRAAVEGAVVPGSVILADVTSMPGRSEVARRGPFDLVVAWDFWEHIYLAEVDPLFSALVSVLVPGGRMISVICTRGRLEQDITVNPGDRFTKENSWLLASGHVTIRRWDWWVEKFCAFEGRVDVVHDPAASKALDVYLSEHPSFDGVMSWRPRNLVIVQKKG